MARFMKPTWGRLGLVGPSWAPCWPNEHCYQSCLFPPTASCWPDLLATSSPPSPPVIERLKTYMAAAKKQTTQFGRNCYWCIVSVPISMSQGRHGFVCVGWWEWTVGRPTSSSVNLSMAASEGPFIADSIAVQFSLQYIFFLQNKEMLLTKSCLFKRPDGSLKVLDFAVLRMGKMPARGKRIYNYDHPNLPYVWIHPVIGLVGMFVFSQI